MYQNKAVILFTVMMLFTCNVHAYVFHVDNFSVNKNGGILFNDGFDDGSPPPTAPNLSDGTPTNYFVNSVMGPEAGGKLTLDSVDAAPGLTALGDPITAVPHNRHSRESGNPATFGVYSFQLRAGYPLSRV